MAIPKASIALAIVFAVYIPHRKHQHLGSGFFSATDVLFYRLWLVPLTASQKQVKQYPVLIWLL
jgi:hypothetical protein